MVPHSPSPVHVDPSRPRPRLTTQGRAPEAGPALSTTQIASSKQPGRAPPSPSEGGAAAPGCRAPLRLPSSVTRLQYSGAGGPCPGDPTELPAPQDVPDPRLAALIPKGFETLGCTWLGAGPPGPSPPDAGAWEVGGDGLQGFGRGSRFSVRRGWEDELSEFPAREKGLLPNWRREGGDQGLTPWSIRISCRACYKPFKSFSFFFLTK